MTQSPSHRRSLCCPCAPGRARICSSGSPCAPPDLAPTRDNLQSDRWHRPKFLLSKDSSCHPPSKPRAVFCEFFLPPSGHLGRSEHKMPPAMLPWQLMEAAVCIHSPVLAPAAPTAAGAASARPGYAPKAPRAEQSPAQSCWDPGGSQH